MKVLVLTRYDRLGASSRLRFLQYLPILSKIGIDFDVQPFFSDEMLQEKYKKGNYSLIGLLHAYVQRIKILVLKKKFDLIWIEKESLPWIPAQIEKALLSGVPYVQDFDDAWFHNYDLHRSNGVRKILGRRLDQLMAGSRLVVGGNNYLVDRAVAAGAAWTEKVPTVIDLERYPAVPKNNVAGVLPKIVWIGSPSTVRYLRELAVPLAALAKKVPFKLRVIGAHLALDGVEVECLPWSEDSEVAAVAACDIGVMPLIDSPWERGKCGYKLIQYMACQLPVVASPVGVNKDIVEEGRNGFLAERPKDWTDALSQLLTQPELRLRMGKEGRHRVETTYCLQVTGPILANLLIKAAKGSNIHE